MSQNGQDAAAKEAYPDGNRTHLENDQLFRAITTNSSFSPELFERLYLQPQNRVAGELRKTFANPTPLGVMGFSVGLLPLSIEFLGWRNSGGAGIATGAASLWFGGVLLIVAGILEFILGNHFPFIVFMGYGSHFLTYATSFMPAFNAVSFFSGETRATAGFEPIFYNSFAYYPLAMSMLSLVFLICSFRTNGVFVLIFILATIGFGTAAGAFFHLGQGNVEIGHTLTVATGGCFFAADLLGWYFLASGMFEIMELPIPSLPVFDLSTVIKPKRKAAKVE